jgi:hypothetical protein
MKPKDSAYVVVANHGTPAKEGDSADGPVQPVQKQRHQAPWLGEHTYYDWMDSHCPIPDEDMA